MLPWRMLDKPSGSPQGELILPLTSWYQLQISTKVGEDTSLLLGAHLARASAHCPVSVSSHVFHSVLLCGDDTGSLGSPIPLAPTVFPPPILHGSLWSKEGVEETSHLRLCAPKSSTPNIAPLVSELTLSTLGSSHSDGS